MFVWKPCLFVNLTIFDLDITYDDGKTTPNVAESKKSNQICKFYHQIAYYIQLYSVLGLAQKHSNSSPQPRL